ncbi:maleylpyruvate isomerase N-terminal domain-containing protein [Streptomyces sp. NPDC056361]|uniref:maleylpyruvate isomerase N-terminal domain-containing protein n=1 Tax=Streptomyces sp. NPDC056361 TaxID=3345795 RepID=UPI0035DCC7B7
MSDALLSALADALAELVATVDTSDGEVLDPDTAVSWLEGTSHTLSGLSPADRHVLDGLVRQAALRRPEGPRRDALLRVPRHLGATAPHRPETASRAATASLAAAASRSGTASRPVTASRTAPTAARPTATTAASSAAVHAVPSAAVHAAHAVPSAADFAGFAVSSGAAHAAACDAVAERVLRFADLVWDADPATPVPTCPGWTLADLTRHLGALHRWTEHLIRTRAAVRVRAGDLPLDLPGDPAAYAGWLMAGAKEALAVLRAADPDLPVWSPGADPHARYYSRWLLSEVIVHLADAELALGGAAGPIDPRTAVDAMDHFLGDAPYIPWIAEPVAHLDRDGAVLRLTARDTGDVRTLALGGGGFTWTRGNGGTEPTGGVEADAGELLLLLHRRYGADDRRFTHTGDRDLLDDWLAATAL